MAVAILQRVSNEKKLAFQIGEMDNGIECRVRSKGFTLVEILVSLAVLTLLVALLAQALSSAQIGVGLVANAALRRQDASTVLANIAKDLSTSVHPVMANFEGADPGARQFQLLINPASVPSGSALRNSDCLFFSSSISSTTGHTGLVGYFVRWGTTAAGAPQPLLCRMFLNTTQALPQLVQIQVATSPDYSTEWINNLQADTNARADVNNGYQGWLADNIIALYVRALDPEMNPIEKYAQSIINVTTIDPTQDYAFGESQVNFGNPSGGACGNQYDSRLGYQYTRSSDGLVINRFGSALPAAIELVIVAAEPKEIGRLTGSLAPYSTSDPADLWNNVDHFIAGLSAPLRETAKVYSTIVPLGKQ